MVMLRTNSVMTKSPIPTPTHSFQHSPLNLALRLLPDLQGLEFSLQRKLWKIVKFVILASFGHFKMRPSPLGKVTSLFVAHEIFVVENVTRQRK